MISVGKRVRDAAEFVLQNADTGLNAHLATACSQLGIEPMQIDWSADGRQYYRAWLTVDQILAAGEAVYPIFCLYVQGSVDQKAQKYTEYSGTARLGMLVYMTVPEGNPIQDFEVFQDAFENAFHTCMHTAAASAVMADMGAHSLRDTDYQRQQVAEGGNNWILAASASMTFEVDQ